MNDVVIMCFLCIGVMGGIFDFIYYGYLVVVSEVVYFFGFDEVVFVLIG